MELFFLYWRGSRNLVGPVQQHPVHKRLSAKGLSTKKASTMVALFETGGILPRMAVHDEAR